MEKWELLERQYKVYPAISSLYKKAGKWRITFKGFVKEGREEQEILKIKNQLQQTYPEFEVVNVKLEKDYSNCLYACYKKHAVHIFMRERKA